MFETSIYGNDLRFETAAGLFSPSGADAGTLFMLECAQPYLDGSILDLACGYGTVGVAIAKHLPQCRVLMSDVNPLACECARRNLKLNGVANAAVMCADGVPDGCGPELALVLANPPYHTDFSVAKKFIEGSFKALAVGGRLLLVVKRLDWYKNKMAAVFGGVKLFERDGYCVLLSEKRAGRRCGKTTATITRKHRKKMAQADSSRRK